MSTAKTAIETMKAVRLVGISSGIAGSLGHGHTANTATNATVVATAEWRSPQLRTWFR